YSKARSPSLPTWLQCHIDRVERCSLCLRSCCCGYAAAKSVLNFFVDPRKNQVGNLQIVPVHHHHVAVAANACFSRGQKAHVALGRIDALFECLAVVEALLPTRSGQPRWGC